MPCITAFADRTDKCCNISIQLYISLTIIVSAAEIYLEMKFRKLIYIYIYTHT